MTSLLQACLRTHLQLRKIATIRMSCSWLGLINVYKFPLDNFHLQDPSIFQLARYSQSSITEAKSVKNTVYFFPDNKQRY